MFVVLIVIQIPYGHRNEKYMFRVAEDLVRRGYQVQTPQNGREVIPTIVKSGTPGNPNYGPFSAEQIIGFIK